MLADIDEPEAPLLEEVPPRLGAQWAAGRQIDLDSAELGIGASAIGAPSGRLDWSVPVTQQNGFKPGETVTYFCRVHPFMRGAFEVTG